MLRVTILSWLASASASCASLPPPEESARAQITRAWREHIAAAMSKDVEGVLAIYADDMVFTIPGATRVAGRAELAQMERTSMASADLLHARHTLHELRVFDDVAYEIGTIEGPVREHGAAARVVTFPYMARWVRRDDGRWQLTYQVGR